MKPVVLAFPLFLFPFSQQINEVVGELALIAEHPVAGILFAPIAIPMAVGMTIGLLMLLFPRSH